MIRSEERIRLMSQEGADGREQLRRQLDDLEQAQRFSVVGSLAVLTQATIRIDDRLDGLENKVDRGFAAVDQRFDAVDRRFEAVDRRFDAVDMRLDAMDKRFDGMETQFGLLADDVRKIGASVERLTGYITRDELKRAV
jgi:tetrahydromethanopterin S-methyltransferase subunit G